ncbi:MAG: FprA family A-type flavoprotein [Actinomycetota bacterium]|nr:MAG: FprA family A-type flavoprotein [Actinomycetota bacterium]
MSAREIKKNVFSVGAIDYKRRMFDELIPLPDGTSYNSYLIRGSDRTALIDSVDPPMKDVLLENLSGLGIKKIDYIIPQHGEQDHSGAIAELTNRFPEAKVVTNNKCMNILIDLLRLPEEKFIVVEDGEDLSLGDKTLKFILTPWVHWPETMSTYLIEDKILFSCDFFGSHYATDKLMLSETGWKKIEPAAKRYYGEIMLPFAATIRKNIEKLKNYDIKLIAPSHGPVHDDISFIMDSYREWSSDKLSNKVIIPYVSMHGSTKKMAVYLKSALEKKGVEVLLFHLTEDDLGDLAAALIDAATIVVATPTVLTGPHPLAVYAAYLVKALRPKVRFISIIGSYGWGGKTVEVLAGIVSTLKAEILDPVVIKGYPTDEDLKALEDLADVIAAKHSEVIK